MMYVTHIRRGPAQKVLRSPLESICNGKCKGYSDIDRVVADEVDGLENDEEGKKEYGSRDEPTCILDAGNREVLGRTVFVVAGLGQGAVPLSRRVHLFSRHGGSLSIVVLSKPIRPVLE